MIQPRKITEMPLGRLNLEIRCPVCQQLRTLDVDARAYAKWRGGMHIQDVMPELSADQRELLISGVDGDCWKELFKGDD